MTPQLRPTFGLRARLIWTAFALSTLVGAAQLGVFYSLQVLRLDREFSGGTDNEWSMQLTWIMWFTLLSTMAGTGYATNLAKRLTTPPTAGTRTALSLAATLGAATGIAPLTLPRIRDAALAGWIDPALTAELALGAALIAGLLLAPLVTARPPLSSNLWGVSSLVWVLAAISLADTMRFAPTTDAGGSYYPPVRLAVLDISILTPIARATFSLPALAVLAGLVFGVAARIAGSSRMLVGLSGAIGPTVIAIAYLIGGPGLSRPVTDQSDAYLGAMIAVVAGLLASSLVALPPRRRRSASDATGDKTRRPAAALNTTS